MTHTTTTTTTTLADLTDLEEIWERWAEIQDDSPEVMKAVDAEHRAAYYQNLKVLKACGWPRVDVSTPEGEIVWNMLSERPPKLRFGHENRLMKSVTGLTINEADFLAEGLETWEGPEDPDLGPEDRAAARTLREKGLIELRIGLKGQARWSQTESGKELAKLIPSDFWK